MAGRQLRLLLWKDYLIRKRKFITLAGIIWASGIMLTFYVVRKNVDNHDFPTCQFPARALPSAGMMPFLQSFICSVSNECSPLDQFEEIPAYEKAKFTQIQRQFSPLLDDTVLELASSMPDAVKLLATLADIADEPTFRDFSKNGLKVKNLFNNPSRVKRYVTSRLELDDDVAQSLMTSEISFTGLLKGNLDRCTPESLSQTLVVQNSEHLNAIVKTVCSLTTEELQKMFMDLMYEVNFSKYIKMLGNMYQKLSGDDRISKLGDFLTALLRMTRIQHFLPPEVTSLLFGKRTDFSYMDLNLIQKFIDLFQPTFGDTKEFRSIKEFTDIAVIGVQYMDKIFGNISNNDTTEDVTDIVLNNIGNKLNANEGLQKINKLFSKAVDTIENINDKDSNIDPYNVLIQITKLIYKFLSKNNKHDVLFYSTLISKLMESAHQVVNINMHLEEITYNVTLRNPQAIKVLKELPPSIVGKAFEGLVSAERTQILTSKLNFPGQMFCDLSKLQNFFLINKTEAESVKKLFCSDSWKNYMTDLITSFGVFNVRTNINDMASLLIQETLGKDTSSQLYSIDKDFQILKNFTKALVTMESEEKPVYDWMKLLSVNEDSKLMKTVNEKSHLGKLMLISVHGALAKEIVKQNPILQYKLTPILLDATTLVTAMNEQLETTPDYVPEGLKGTYGNVVKTILMTALDEDKTYKSLSKYCVDILCYGGENAANYVQFPNGADVETIASALCNASMVIEEGLKNDSAVSKAIIKIRNTTHTILEQINWTRLINNIQKLYVKLNKDYPYIFEYSTYDMDNATQEEVQKLYKNAKDFWFSMKHLQRGLHLSVKLGFRLLDMLDHGIFNMTSEHWIKMKFVMSSSIGPLTVLDDTIKLITALITNTSSASHLPPITVNAVSRIIPNVPQLMVDAVNIMVNDNTDIDPIISLLNTEPQWPCSTTSLSELLELTASSQDAVRALEALLCMETDLQMEWMVYLDERKARLNKSLTWNNTVFDPHVFLDFSSTFDALVKDSNLVKSALQHILDDDASEDHVGLKSAWAYAVRVMNTTERNTILRKFLHKFDLVLNSITTPPVGNVSVNALWSTFVGCGNASGQCRGAGRAAAAHTARAFAVILREMAVDLTEYFTEVHAPGSNLLQMLGFTRSTALYMLYDRLPEFVGMLVNSYWDFGFMSQVRRASLTHFWDCEAVVSALAPAPDSAIQSSDIARVQPYLCPSLIYWFSLPKGDNVLFNLVAKPQYFFYTMPAENATSVYEDAFTKATDLADFLTKVAEENRSEIANELKLNSLKLKLAKFVDKIVNFKLNNTNTLYKQFSEVNRKQFVSNIYLTRVVAIANTIATEINNITIDESTDSNEKEAKKLNADLKIVKNIFKRKSVDAIAILYDVFTDIFWTNDSNYTLIDAMDSACNDLKADDKRKTILVDEVRTKLQLCAKNYKYLFGKLQGAIEDDYEDARQSLLNFVDILQSGNDSNVTDIFEFLNNRKQQMASLKRSIKYSYDMGLPIYLQYLQSNLQSYNIVLIFLSGGDWWKELRLMYGGPYAQKFFGYLDDSFEIAHDFLNNLDGVHLVRLIRDMNLNDSESFCRPNITLSDYIPDATQSLSELKFQICETDKVQLFKEIPPLLYASQGYESDLALPKDIDYEALSADITRTRSNLELIALGPKDPQRPSWVTDEKLDIFRRDVMNLLSKETMTKIVFGILSNVVDAGTLFLNNSQCAPCSQMTSWFKQLNLQLFKKQEYDSLLCHLHTLTDRDVYRALKDDFHWDMFVREVISTRNYTKFELNKSISEFLALVKGHLLEDIAAPSHKLADCLAGNVTRNEFGNVSLILTVVSRTARLLRAQTPHLHDIDGIKDLPFLNQLYTDVAHNLDVLRPVKDYSNRLDVALGAVISDNEVVLDVEGADVNLRTAKKATRIEDVVHLRSNVWEHICEDHNCSAIYTIVMNNLNVTKIEKDLPSLQSSEFWRFSFMSSILRHVEDMSSHAARLVGAAGGLGAPAAVGGRLEAMLDLMMRVLMDDTFDSIVYSIQGLIDEMHPLLKGTPLEGDLDAVASGLKIFHQLKTHLVDEEDLKLQVSNWFPNAEAVEQGLRALGINNTDFWSLAAPRVHAGYIQLRPVLSSKEPNYHIATFVCDVDAMSTVVLPGAGGAGAGVTDVLAATAEQFCALTDGTSKQLVGVLAGNMDKELIMDKLKEHLLTKLYSASDLTAEEGSRVLERFPRLAGLLPRLRGVGGVLETLQEEPLFQSFRNFSSVGNLMSSGDFLSDAGTMLCGKPFQTGTSRIIKTIISIPDLTAEADQAQLDVLPTDFCRSMYQDIISMEGGKIMWSFVKPLIMGRILYTPRHPTVDRIMEKANSSFASMIRMANLVHSFSSAFPSLVSMSSHRAGLAALQRLVAAPGMEDLRKMILGDQGVVEVDVDEMFQKVGDLEGIGSLMSKASDLLHCIHLDRFQPVQDEQQLMLEAAKLLAVNEFSAGIVFLNVDHLNDSLANVEYKIRMDIENAPTTKYLKPYLWTPGPESSFIENMRYFRGFVQIQDLLDQAIIKLSAEGSRSKRDAERADTEWAVYTQQEPYPCYRKDFFQASLYESQSLIVAFFFSLLFTVASVVRFIVADKESGNTMLMSVMGVNLAYHTLSWFLSSLVEVCATVAAVTAILRWGEVLPRTDPTLVFALLMLFGLSVLSFCYLMSKLFTSASFAAVCAGVAYLVTFMPFVMILSLEAVMVSSLKLLVCLSMSSSLCYAFLYIARYEAMGAGAHWRDVWSSPNDDSMSIAYAAVMIAVDALLYLAIGYCIDKYFGIKSVQSSVTNCASRDEKAGVSVVGVTKVYGERSRRPKVALDNVSIELHKGQITALLGHNGAGKTTLINILTGMLKPTSGSVTVRSSRDVTRLGVCPQHDVLFDSLTAREHVALYAQLKSGLAEDEVKDEVDRMLRVLSLGPVSSQVVSSLSGGTRRRLCVALAFVGRPTLVVLDEPTAGVDPAARRDIWSMIVKLKEDRTILLTTHHLDEAELLSDQIVIMHRGQIHTTGSPIEIKRTLGNGYKLTVSLPERQADDWEYSVEEKTKQLLALIRDVVRNASVADISNGEVEISLPFYDTDGANNNLLQVCEVLEQSQAALGFRSFALDCSSLEQVFFDICQRADAGVPDYAEDLTKNEPSKSVSSSSIRSESAALVAAGGARRGSRPRQLRALLRARFLHLARNRWLLFMLIALPSLFVTIAMAFSTLRPPADNEIALTLSEDLYSASTQYLVPNPSIYSDAIDPMFAQRVMHQLKSNKQKKDWTIKDTPTCECVVTRQECRSEGNATRTRPLPGMMILPDVDTLNTWLVNSHDVYIEKRYGGFTSTLANNRTNLIAWYNNKGHHAMPSYLNALNNAILRTVAGNSRRITAYSHPLKISKEQISKDTVYQHIADAGISALVLVAFSLVSAGGAIYLVSSRARQEKRLQLLCGVTPALYWGAALAADMMIITVNMLITAAVMWAFGFPVFVARNNLPAICILFLLYGFACGSLIHCAEKLFRDASLANMMLFCGNTFLGLAGIVLLLILDIISESDATDAARRTLHKLFLLSPQFALGDGMLEVARNTIQAQVLSRFGMDTYRDPLSSDLLLLHYCYLLCVGVALALFNLALEYGHLQWIQDRLVPRGVYLRLGERLTPEPAEVAAERLRAAAAAEPAPPPLSIATIGNINRGFVHTEGANNSLQRAAGAAAARDVAACAALGKAYGTRVAVRALSLCVPPGQCTALLGENGAGKSTTFALLTGSARPTRGHVMLHNKRRDQRTLARGLVSYCPQSDAIDPLLTVTETLQLYCELRGITEQNDVIDRTLEMFELRKYAAVRSGALSGGNRRKLCTAVALMGRAPLVLLDEPTSGMDPMSRACVSRGVCAARSAGRGVLLSTHALHDARRLADRVALLRRGELVATAPREDALARFGGGYVVACRACDARAAWRAVRAAAPRARLQLMHEHVIHFLLPTRNTVEEKELPTPASAVLRTLAALQAAGDIRDYTLNQSSLEQMFLSFTDKAAVELGTDTPSIPETDQLDSVTAL